MLNIKKAKNLQGQVGNGSDTKIWKKAKDLYGKANTLAIEPKLASQAELKKPAQALATGVGASESEGLQKALKELKDASVDSDIVKKAMEVIKKYNAVDNAYNDVKEQETQYTNALTTSSEQQKYNNVKTDFEALERAYNLAKCKKISLILDKEMIRYCSISLYTYPYHNPRNLNLLHLFLYSSIQCYTTPTPIPTYTLTY